MAGAPRQLFNESGGWPAGGGIGGVPCSLSEGGDPGPAVEPLGEGMLAGDSREWEYSMRRGMQEVIPGVFLGPYAVARKNQLESLLAAGITHIVCVRQNAEATFVRPNFPDHFLYLVVDVADDSSENIISHFPEVREFIDQALDENGRVLMHGNAGISRSGALLIAYLMYKLETTYAEALRLVQLRRFCVAPNEGFQAQLHEYEPIYRAELMQKRFAADVSRGDVSFGSGPPKRTFDETDDMDDDDEHEHRNPATFPPAAPVIPLPGHSAHVHHDDGHYERFDDSEGAMEPA
mmetsp:Transcript_123848/g.174655  ORF Transcript_123848/g.174655 Transcript_123848/m.174655 type:complete len:292 (-) Transcript_123848:26-901(-)